MAFTAQQGIGNRSTGSAGVGFQAAEMGAGHTLGSGGADGGGGDKGSKAPIGRSPVLL